MKGRNASCCGDGWVDGRVAGVDASGGDGRGCRVIRDCDVVGFVTNTEAGCGGEPVVGDGTSNIHLGGILGAEH